MANTIGYGQGAVNNTNGFGKAPTNNTIDFGEVCADSWSPETNLVGGSSFSNTKSIELDGMDAFVSMGNTLNLANDGTDAFSISCWLKTTDLNTQILAGKQINAAPYNGYNFTISASAIRLFLGTTTSNARLQGTTATIPSLTDGNWHHLALTYDGSQDISGFTIYYDNTTPAITTTYNNTPTSVSNSAEFILGARGTTSSYAGLLNGSLDEVAYFNSELSASDVSTIYGTGVPSDISTISGLVSWWRFEGTGLTATDSGSGGNDGLLDNTVVRSSDVPT